MPACNGIKNPKPFMQQTMIMPTMKKKTQRKSFSSKEFPSPVKTMEIPKKAGKEQVGTRKKMEKEKKTL
jgi:hypothetical protein